jgi:hypothetical protein
MATLLAVRLCRAGPYEDGANATLQLKRRTDGRGRGLERIKIEEQRHIDSFESSIEIELCGLLQSPSSKLQTS